MRYPRATCAWNGVAANVDDLKEITERKVNSIAYIEVKKNAESKPRSDDNEIMEYAIRDRDYLKRQLDIIDPQIIFLGGTKKCYDLIEETKHIVHSMHKGNNRLIVDFYHPSFVMAFDAFLYHLSNNFYSDEIARIIETMKSMS